MNKKLYITIATATLLFVGCGASNNAVSTPHKTVKKVSKPTVDPQGRPLWVSNPNINGNIGVVSVVPKKKIKNKKKLYYIAKLKAQAEFQTRKGTNIDAKSETKMSSNGQSSFTQDVKISSQHIQTKNLRVKKTYEDKDYFYMWMVAN